MIDTIEIENFQSHRHTTVQLSPGVNVIKGRSHSGKSSVMRAIRWALLNQPRGENFVSHFKGDKEVTSVGIQFDDGRHATRLRRGGSKNGYESSSGSFKALRSDVPEEITEITKMEAINVQMQGAPYFMLSETPGKVASH